MASLTMNAQTCQILKKQNGAITFVVDENLPKPTQSYKDVTNIDEAPTKLVQLYRKKGVEGIVATSFTNEPVIVSGKSPFFTMMINAYADHHAVTLTPDVVWLLISQALGHNINKNPELYRKMLVDFDGTMDLFVESKSDLLSENVDWDGLVGNLAKQIQDNTKDEIAQTVTANFSTTGSTERLASQITLMDAVKWYFRYNVIMISCGIPQITLEGTPEDWAKLTKKAERLANYGQEDWINNLLPILKEFEKAANGKPNRKFWQNIVCKVRPGVLRGAGACGSEKDATKIDGWFLKLLPFDSQGSTPDWVTRDHSFISETVQVPFSYIKLYPGEQKETTPMELWAGLVGYKEDPTTKAYSMTVGWLVRDASGDPKVEKGVTASKMNNKDYDYGIVNLTVDTVPDVLKGVKAICELNLTFRGVVEIPTWMENIQIDTLRIKGNMSDEQKEQLKKRFPKVTLN